MSTTSESFDFEFDSEDERDDAYPLERGDNDESSEAPADQAVNFIEFDTTRCLPQTQSVLFKSFPGEIRDYIFYYALCDYEDNSVPYDENTCYRRPGYFAPRRTDTALLRTCQQVYREAWFLPWTTKDHTLFLTSPDRCPVRTITAQQMLPTLNLIYAIHGKTEIDHLRIFPQLYSLEPGRNLQHINDSPHFYPRRFTITIRHTDWWYWEDDMPLRFDSKFVNVCRFPESVTELRFELESIERRKEQIISIAKQMMEKWQFQRKDGVRLSAKGSVMSVTRWSGSSTWGGRRWLRDETRPETLDYYVATIIFRPVRKDLANDEDLDNYQAPKLEVKDFSSLVSVPASVPTSLLRAMDVPPGTSAEEVREMKSSYEQRLRRRLPPRSAPTTAHQP